MWFIKAKSPQEAVLFAAEKALMYFRDAVSHDPGDTNEPLAKHMEIYAQILRNAATTVQTQDDLKDSHIDRESRHKIRSLFTKSTPGVFATYQWGHLHENTP